MPGVNKAVDLLKENFTFTAFEIAQNFQDSYGYALAAISSGLSENQRVFWKSLFQANVEVNFRNTWTRIIYCPLLNNRGCQIYPRFDKQPSYNARIWQI